MRRFATWSFSTSAVRVAAIALTIAWAMIVGPGIAVAQPAADAAFEQAAASDEAAVSTEDVRALVAPVALFPDPMLALVLQASTQPLQVVQANRFLAKRQKEPTLTPDQDWDSSILGLLNYPAVLGAMNEYIDWTEALGNAVLDQLGDVQNAVVDIRWGAYNTGILVSNDQQTVVAEGDIIRVMPADGKTISVPQYDPVALLAAIEPDEQVAEVAEAAAPAAEPTATAPAAAPAAPAPSEPGFAAEPADPGYAATPAYAEGYPPGYGAGYPPPYAGPPIVSYAEPETGFWDSAASFAGGAVIGGLLGWGISEAFDDDDWDWDGGGGGFYGGRSFSRTTNIEGNTVVVNRDRDNQRIQDQLGDRRPDRDRVQRPGKDPKPLPGLGADKRPGRDQAGKQPRRADGPKREVKLPGAGTGAGIADRARPADRTATAARPAASAKPAVAKRPAGTAKAKASGTVSSKKGSGLAASVGPRTQVRKEAARGAKSRAVAKGGGGGGKAVRAAAGGGQHRAVQTPSRGKSSMASGARNGGKAKAHSSRGKASKASGGGGGARGGRKRG
jgi:hypothetical protein